MSSTPWLWIWFHFCKIFWPLLKLAKFSYRVLWADLTWAVMSYTHDWSNNHSCLWIIPYVSLAIALSTSVIPVMLEPVILLCLHDLLRTTRSFCLTAISLVPSNVLFFQCWSFVTSVCLCPWWIPKTQLCPQNIFESLSYFPLWIRSPFNETCFWVRF